MIEKRYCLTPEEWAYAKAELVLAEKLGLIENAGIEALEKDVQKKMKRMPGLNGENGILRTARIHCRCIYEMN